MVSELENCNIRFYCSGPEEDPFLNPWTTNWAASEKSLKTTSIEKGTKNY